MGFNRCISAGTFGGFSVLLTRSISVKKLWSLAIGGGITRSWRREKGDGTAGAVIRANGI